jgi:hypothetical protein
MNKDNHTNDIDIKVKMMIRNQTLGWPWQQNS